MSTGPQVHTNKLFLLHIHDYTFRPQVHRSTLTNYSYVIYMYTFRPHVHSSTGPQSQVLFSQFKDDGFKKSHCLSPQFNGYTWLMVRLLLLLLLFFFSEGMVFDVSAHGNAIIYALEPWILRVPVLIAGLRILISLITCKPLWFKGLHLCYNL